jgi:hypothetical protein
MYPVFCSKDLNLNLITSAMSAAGASGPAAAAPGPGAAPAAGSAADARMHLERLAYRSTGGYFCDDAHVFTPFNVSEVAYAPIPAAGRTGNPEAWIASHALM